jgi:acyl-coenzyme A synthetase/AMP-(fatty) acid ligase
MFQLFERVGFRGMDLPDLRVVQQAGGALDQTITRMYAEHLAAKGGALCVMYGQTEATARMAFVPPGRLLDHLGSAGIPIPGGSFRIEATQGDASAGRAVGEVIYEGPNVMLGYAEGWADLVKPDELHGVLRTGDLGYLDEDGFLYLVGRSKRIAKVFGVRVNLDEVERMLGETGPVAVVGGDDAIWAYCAFGTDESLEQLAVTIARRLRLHRSAVRLRRVEGLPTSSTGKIDYREVERWTST